jgi:hypothetical protein
MLTLTINNRAALEVLAGKPADRARLEKPRIRLTSTFGRYEVQSTSKSASAGGGRWYTVTCDSVTRSMHCNCPARVECKHLSAVLPVHTYQARLRPAPGPVQPAPALAGGSSEEPYDFNLEAGGGTAFCQDCAIDEACEESETLQLCQFCFNSYLDSIQYSN